MMCISCGKREAEIEGKCKPCFLAENPIVTSLDFNVSLCAYSNHFEIANKWHEFTDIEEAVLKTIKRNIKINPIFVLKDIKLIDIDLSKLHRKPGKKNMVDAIIEVIATFEDHEISEQYDLKFTINSKICPYCKKNDTQYFESVLQLRNVTQEIVDFFEARVEENHIKGIYYSKKKKIKSRNTDEGRVNWDYYLTSHNFAVKLAKILRKKVHGEVKISRKQFTRDHMTSEMVYRGAVLFRQEYRF